MIVNTPDGRHKTVVTKEEKRDAILKQWRAMSPEERKVVRQVLYDEFYVLSKEGELGFDSVNEAIGMSSLYHTLKAEHYEDQIVPIDEFLLNDYYLGHVGKSLYSKWYEDLNILYSDFYNKLIITGSIGSGKTTFGDIALIRDFYELCMLKDPQSTFGLMPGSEIVFVCFNRDKRLARDVTYGGVKSKMEMSQCFRDLGIKFGGSELVYEKKNIRIIAVSVRSSDALGRNVYGGIIDETDFLEGSVVKGDGIAGEGEKSFADKLHESIMRRMSSRYESAGLLPGKLILSSSARHKESFTNRLIAEEGNDPGVFVRDYALYDVKPEKYSKEKFDIMVGINQIPHKILADGELEAMGDEKRQEMLDKGCRFIKVPVSFKRQYERDLEGCIRDISGIVTASVELYIRMQNKIEEAEDPTLFHPFDREVWVTNEMPVIDWSKLVHHVRERIAPGQYEERLEPIRHPDAPRHVHIDLSLGKQDCAGMCMAHTVDMIEMERVNAGGEDTIEDVPLMEVDFFLRIAAPPGGEIDIGAVRGIVYEFVKHGYTVSFASLDSFQSRESIQKFRFQGIPAEIVSVDKNTDAYDTLKTALYEERISYYKYPVLRRELKRLRINRIKGKVDHPPGKEESKDVADALAGVAYTLSNDVSFTMPLQIGVSESPTREKDTEWIRQTMTKSGSAAPRPVKEDSIEDDGSGPLFFSG